MSHSGPVHLPAPRPTPLPEWRPLSGDWAALCLSLSDPAARPDAHAAWRALPGPVPVAAALAHWGEDPLGPAPLADLDAQTWWFRCRFSGPTTGEAAEAVTLVFDGLATLATVWLDGEPLLESRNMFRAHGVTVPARRWQPGPHELLIRCAPLAEALAQRRPRPRWRVPMVSHQQLRAFRTSLLGRTPGWSPPVPVVGPWQGLRWHTGPALPPPRWTTERVGRGGRVRVHLPSAWPPEVVAGVQARLRLVQRPGGAAPDAAAHAPTDAPILAPTQESPPLAWQDGAWVGDWLLPEVAPWWPHTLGEPVCHQLSLVLQWPNGDTQVQALGRVGFRQVDLDQTESGFRLRINGEPVFARGLCWTPQDSLRLHADPALLRERLTRLREAGANLLRVGGTMAYESDAFHDLCDELGLMVWQDLMFASMDHPFDDADFRAEVQAELEHQAGRWQGRPGLVLLCGNSEVAQQAAMWGAPRADWSHPFYDTELPAWAAQRLPGLPCWPSSAQGGALPFLPAEGSCSYYGVGAYQRELADARHSGLRFASECLAFANLPDEAGLARLRGLNQGRPVPVHAALWKARSPRDLGAGWDFDDVRDHYLERVFGLRADALRAHDPARHQALGRVVVAELMRGCFDQWRMAGSRCGGALVWFLRDLWVGAGWGVWDEQGHPKSAFHGLASAWQPLHLGLVDDGLNGLQLHLDNETATPQAGRLCVAWLRDGQVPVAQGEAALTLPPRSRQGGPVQAWLDGFVDGNWAYRFGPPVADVCWARWCSPDGRVQAERLWFAPGRVGPTVQGGVTVQALALPDGRRRLQLHTAQALRGVHVLSEGWRAEREFFDVPPGEPRDLVLQPADRAPAGRLPPWRVMLHAANLAEPVVVGAPA